MKRILQHQKAIFALLFAFCLGMGMAFASDFSTTCSTGQTLYYNIIDATNHYVEITYPGTISSWLEESDKPTGEIALPSSVTHNGITYTVRAIGDYAFYKCSGLTGTLTVPNSITSIGIRSFYECTGFTGPLTIPNSVTIIGSSAFHFCSGFTGSLTLSNSLTEIKNYTFYGCSGLTGSLNIPNSVTTIGESAFYSCTSFTGTLTLGNSLTTIGASAFQSCFGFTGSLNIPNSVTTIGDYAFWGCSGFTGSLTIGNSVTTIGDLAFCGCTGFAGSLTLGSSVTTIGDSAFSECNQFTGGLTIPNTVTMIDDYAFAHCRNFTGSLTIPNSVTTIGMRAFFGCESFSGSLTIGNSVTEIAVGSFDNCKHFSSLILGNSVTTIGDWAFYSCYDFEGRLTLPNSLTTIGNGAFSKCFSLTSIETLAETPPTLGDDAFNNVDHSIPVIVPCGTMSAYQNASGWNEFTNIQEDCDPLTYSINPDGLSVTVTGHKDGTAATGELIIPETKTIDGITYTVTAIDHLAFANCSGLTGSLTIPNSVTTIGNMAFVNCSGFDGSLTIGNSVTEIYPEAFAHCSGFTGSLVIPDSVKMIREGVFAYCSGFTGSLTLSNSMFFIGDAAFAYCSGFTGDLVIPDAVEIINSEAFMNCSGFTGSLTIGHSVLTIGYSAFKNCSGFTQVNFNATDCQGAYLDDKPFQGCGGTLTIGDNVERIPSWMFFDCPGFTGDLVIPNSVIMIEEYAFYCCTGFNGSLTIGNSVNSIGDLAFGACPGFSSLTIGSSVAEIGYYAFAWCGGLTSMSVYREAPPELGLNVFEEVSTTIPVYVPCGSYSAYHNATGWSAFADMQEFSCLTYSINPDGVSVTVTGHVDGTAATGELIIPETTIIDGVAYTVTAIGEQAFDHCYYLTDTLNIPNSVTTIGRGAFYYCVGFTGLTLGNSVTTIEEYAFSNCENLTGSLTFPDSVTTLGNGAFGYCSGITSITSYPETPPTLGSSAFQNVPTTIPVHVPCGSLEDYQTASGWSAFNNWHCICVPYSLPYAYGFEDSYEFDCWTMLDCDDQTGIYPTAAHEGGYSFRFYYNTNPPQYLISPELEGTSGMIVSFYYKNALDRYPETFQVGYSTTTQLPSAFTWYDEVTANNQNTWIPYEDFVPEGTKYVAVKLTSNDQFYLYLDDFSFTPAPSCLEPTNLTVTNITSNSAEVHWTGEQDSYNVRYRTIPDGSWVVETTQLNSFMDGFEDGLDQWTLIDADGDGSIWDYGQISGCSAHGGSIMAFSFSWYGGHALTPDNYLVTPCVNLGGTVTFWASAGDLNDAAEHFGIAVSTASNTNPSDFTMIQEWTMTAKGGGQGGSRGNRDKGTWYQYTVDLSAYAGQTGYIALRHFNCTDQFALAVDDFSYDAGVIPSGITLMGLNPTTTYEVQVQGICPYGIPEWSESITFTTASSVVTQTIELVEGWNWISTYIDMNEVDGLTMLELALGDNAEMIKSKTLVDEFDGEEWYRDDDMALTNEEMFMIYAVNACTVTLEGPVANPAEHQIAINPGWNWIGYPCAEEVAINVALSGFEPEDGDAIKCYNNIAEADGGEWYADEEEMETLKPGQGYMYYSNSSIPKTLIFSTTAEGKSVFLRKRKE